MYENAVGLGSKDLLKRTKNHPLTETRSRSPGFFLVTHKVTDTLVPVLKPLLVIFDKYCIMDSND